MNIDQFFNLLSIISWVIFFIIVVGAFITNWIRLGISHAFLGLFSRRTVIGIIPVILITLLSLSVVFIPPTHSGVVVSFLAPRGYREDPLTSGRHFIFPVAEQVVMYPIYQQTYTMSSNPVDGNELGNDTIAARTSDGQEVFIDISIIFSVDSEQVVSLHILWQDRYVEDLIRPLVRGVVRTQVAAFTVAEVNSIRRQDLERQLNEEITEDLQAQGILMDSFLLRNIAFSPEYAASVEQKQIALERRTESEYQADVIRTIASGRADEMIRLAEARAEARLIEAQAEAEALQLIANVLATNEVLLTYEYIDKLAPNIGVIVVPQDNPLILPLTTNSDQIRPQDLNNITQQSDMANTNDDDENNQQVTPTPTLNAP